MDTQFQTPTKQDKQHQGTQGKPKEQAERRNPESNH
jgi:hypothetical protein